MIDRPTELEMAKERVGKYSSASGHIGDRQVLADLLMVWGEERLTGYICDAKAEIYRRHRKDLERFYKNIGLTIND